MKRFWAETSVVAEGATFLVRLDGKPLKLPGGKPLAVPFRALAQGIAGEWARASRNFTLDALPLTRLAATAQDRVAVARTGIIQQLAAFGTNDLLCYRAANEPLLAAREAAAWQPWLDWANGKFGIELKSTHGITPIEQSPACGNAFIFHLGGMTEYQLAGLGVIVPTLGSLVLGLAVECGAMAPDAACESAHLGELWQEARWGADEEAIARRAAIARDIAESKQFMVLCQS